MRRNLLNLDLDLVRSFVSVLEEANFTRAAERIGRQQSTVSLQIKRLEATLNCKLLHRTPHTVRPTPEGSAFLPSARRLLALNDEIIAHATEPQMQGVVRLGTPEDFASHHLSKVLERFAAAYPAVLLEVTCDLTLNLIAKFRSGAFDLALVKRERTLEADGVRVWHEPLVWVEGGRDLARTADKLPLVVSPEPCVYRHRAVETLDQAHRAFRIAYVCGSLAGSLAAVRAGLGVTILPFNMVPKDLNIIGEDALPVLVDTEIGLLHAAKLSEPALRLQNHIISSLQRVPAA
jgi:DNA-binding transcriptional LysR family regulator